MKLKFLQVFLVGLVINSPALTCANAMTLDDIPQQSHVSYASVRSSGLFLSALLLTSSILPTVTPISGRSPKLIKFDVYQKKEMLPVLVANCSCTSAYSFESENVSLKFDQIIKDEQNNRLLQNIHSSFDKFFIWGFTF